MPGGRAGFFSGLVEGLGGAFVDQKKQQHQQEQEDLDRKFKAGMMLFDKGFEDVGADLLGSTISSQFLGPDGKPPKGKKDGILGLLSNPKAVGGLLKGLHKGITFGGGAPQPGSGASASEVDQIESGNGPQASASPFRSRAQGEAAAEAADQRKETFKTSEEIRRDAAKAEAASKTAKVQWTPGQTSGKDLSGETDFQGKPIDPEKSYKVGQKGDGSPWLVPIEQPQRKPSDYKSFEQTWLVDAGKGGSLSPAQQRVEMLKARKAWALAGQTDTGAEKLSRGMALEKYKSELSAISPQDVKDLSQSVTIGGKTTSYFDISSVSGAKEKNAAVKAATANGIVAVSPKQVEQLESAGAASANLTGFLDQIKGKLPQDAQSRPLTSIENKMNQFFQSDEELASAVSWDVSVLPMLRAMNVAGRITNIEFQTALAARPRLTDTVGVAAKKVQVIDRMLGNATNQILNRGGRSTSTPSSPSNSTKDTPQRRTAAQDYLKTHGLPASEKNIQHYLDSAQ